MNAESGDEDDELLRVRWDESDKIQNNEENNLINIRPILSVDPWAKNENNKA